MDICNRIKRLRKDRKMTQQALADATGLSRLMISKVETGENQPTIKHIEKMSSFFDVSTDYLINGNDDALNKSEREIINAVRKDKSLFDVLNKMIKTKKEFEALAA